MILKINSNKNRKIHCEVIYFQDPALIHVDIKTSKFYHHLCLNKFFADIHYQLVKNLENGAQQIKCVVQRCFFEALFETGFIVLNGRASNVISLNLPMSVQIHYWSFNHAW